MNALLDGLLQASIWLAIAVLLVCALRPLLRQLGGASLVYASWWLLPVVVLVALLPVPLMPAVVTAALPMQTLAPLQVSGMVGTALDARQWPLLLGLWTMGAAWMLIANLRRQRQFERALGTLVPRADGAWQASTDPGLPALVGLWQPRIVVGPDFDRTFDAGERGLVLAHEHSHRRHGDHWANAVVLLLRCVFWFHPLLPWAARRFVRDQELACDARTIGPHPALRRTYASALLKAQMAHPAAPMACYWRSHTLLKERIVMLKDSERGRLARACGRVIVASLCIGVATVAWASQQVAGSPSGSQIHVQAAPAAGQGVAAGVAEQDAVALVLTAPKYPKGAFAAGEFGNVVLHVQVLADGKVGEVTVQSSTNPIFDAASIEAARQWTFRPAVQNGKPVASVLRIPVDFALDKDENV